MRREIKARITALEAALARRGSLIRLRSTPRPLSSPLKGASLAAVLQAWLATTEDDNFNRVVAALGAVLFRDDPGTADEALDLALEVDRLLSEGRGAEAEELIASREPATEAR